MDSRPVQLPDCPGVCVQEITPIVPQTTVVSIPSEKDVGQVLQFWLPLCCMEAECSCPRNNKHPAQFVCYDCSCDCCFCCCGNDKLLPPYVYATFSCCCIGYASKPIFHT